VKRSPGIALFAWPIREGAMWSRPVAGTMTGVRALELPWWPLAAAMAAVLLAIPFARLALRSRRRGREARDPHRAAEQEAAAGGDRAGGRPGVGRPAQDDRADRRPAGGDRAGGPAAGSGRAAGRE